MEIKAINNYVELNDFISNNEEPVIGEISVMSPQMAGRILGEKNPNNIRKMSRQHIENIKEQIIDGKWRPEIGFITFHIDGTLIDGQHRLQAIFEAGRNVNGILIKSKSTDDDLKVIDQHRPRAARNNLKNVSIDQQKVANAIKMYGHEGLKISGKLTTYDLDNVLREYGNSIDFILGLERPTKKPNDAAFLSSLALIHHFDESKANNIIKFVNALRGVNNIGLSVIQNGDIVVLNRWLFNEKNKPGNSSSANDRFAATQNAFKRFTKNETIKRIQPSKIKKWIIEE